MGLARHEIMRTAVQYTRKSHAKISHGCKQQSSAVQ